MSVLALKNTLWCDSSPKEWLCSVNPWWQTCENCHGRLRDAAPFKSLHCQARSYRWGAACVCSGVSGAHLCGPGQGARTSHGSGITQVGHFEPLCVSLETSRAVGQLLSPHCSLNIHLAGQGTNLIFKNKYLSSWGHDPGWVSQCAVFKKHYGIQNEIIFLLIIMAVNWSASRPEPTVCNWIFNLFCVV